jgi:AraC-like DNA-binding protein
MSLTIAEGLRLAAAGQLVLVLGLLLRDHRRSRVTAASALLVTCVVGYLALPALAHTAAPEIVRRMAGTAALAVPFAFWLAARVYFDDSFQPGMIHTALLLGLLAARAAVLSWPLATSGIAMVAVVDALRRIHAGSAADLLLSRLRLRYAIQVGTGTYALTVLIAEAIVVRGSHVDAWLSVANDLGLYVMVTTICMIILRVEPDLVKAGARRPVALELPSFVEKRLEQLIEAEQIFKTEGLTIGALAERLGEPEYKVRQLINARLGFRNFVAFLNHYRIREARKVLGDPGQRHLGVAEVAYRFGYSSLGPFNRAFKEIAGQTPTEYRKAAQEQEMLADSKTGEGFSKSG